MNVLLEIKDSKATHLMEVLKGLSYVKTTTLSPEAVRKIRLTKTEKKAAPVSKEKARIIKGIKQAVKEVNLMKAGKLKSVSLKEFLDEL
jgi:hypothetical protein